MIRWGYLIGAFVVGTILGQAGCSMAKIKDVADIQGALLGLFLMVLVLADKVFKIEDRVGTLYNEGSEENKKE